MEQIKKIIFGLGLCLMMDGCHSIYNSEYYIPVDNQMGDAKPLSKNDIIRVVLPHVFPDYLANTNNDNKKNGWKWTDLGVGLLSARDKTTVKLQNLGYTVVDVGYFPKNDGHPTVIALVDSAPIEGSSRTETHTWDAPVFTDSMGRTTLSEKQGVTITHTTYYYKVKLVRPEGKNNSLFDCNSSYVKTRNYCIAPANPSNYKVIFSGYATISTDNTVAGINLSHLTTAVFNNYPNMMGKKWVYFTNTGYTPIYVTEPNAPKPTDKKKGLVANR